MLTLVPQNKSLNFGEEEIFIIVNSILDQEEARNLYSVDIYGDSLFFLQLNLELESVVREELLEKQNLDNGKRRITLLTEAELLHYGFNRHLQFYEYEKVNAKQGVLKFKGRKDFGFDSGLFWDVKFMLSKKGLEILNVKFFHKKSDR